MKKHISSILFIITLIASIFYSCTKDVGSNPMLAYTDKALYDSCRNDAAFEYYKNSSAVIQVAAGSNSPHGPFKLKFNKIANAALTDNGKLPIGQKFPDGSLVVKEVQPSGLYALMYKKSGSWLWAEIASDGTTSYSVNKDGVGCISCHSQSGQRDMVVSFNYY